MRVSQACADLRRSRNALTPFFRAITDGGRESMGAQSSPECSSSDPGPSRRGMDTPRTSLDSAVSVDQRGGPHLNYLETTLNTINLDVTEKPANTPLTEDGVGKRSLSK